MQTEIQKLKDQVQEIHRDLTKHHSLIKTDTMSEILDRSLEMDGEISSEYASVEMMRAMFEEVIINTDHICSCGGLASSSVEKTESFMTFSS